MIKSSSRGSIMLLIIIFGAVFFTVLVALSGFVLAQNRLQEVTRGRGEAFAVAEAGLDYYRWFLSHFPGNTTSGTGHAGPYVSAYSDPESGAAGTYSLTITGNSSCGTMQSIDVTSTGVPNDVPTVSSTVWARYAQPSVARYSMIVGASTWFDGTIFHGPMHSNGGLRMDNTHNNASVTSSLTSWTCDSSFGCRSGGQTVAGVFGNGSNQNLWSYPTPQLDFAAISSNFSSLKTTAVASGLYFARTSTKNSTHLGYHLIFNGNSTVTVKKVTAVNQNLDSIPVDGSTGFSTMANDYSLISSETTLGTYTIPSGCGVIFVEDNAWIEGSINTKVTVVAADATNQGVYPTIVLPNNITYTAFDGTAGLTAIASDNILIGPNTPQDLTLDGIFVAQSGAFGRNLYDCTSNSGGSSYQYRGKLTMLGSIVSMIRQNNYWIGTSCSGAQGSWSGYPDSTWNFVFDRQNSTNPPPFTPTTSTQWQFVDWRQI